MGFLKKTKSKIHSVIINLRAEMIIIREEFAQQYIVMCNDISSHMVAPFSLFSQNLSLLFEGVKSGLFFYQAIP